MKMKKWLSLALCLGLCAGLAGCSDGTAVYVQSVEALSNLGGIAPGDRFAGLVVSENVTEIEKDADKRILELLVKEGDDVKEGQELFSYDTEELQLSLDKLLLEVEQLKGSIESYQAQIETLEKERKSVGEKRKLEYTIQIQSTQVDLKEAELNLHTKETEVTKAQTLLENATVVSPIDGRIQSISENGTDNYGNELPFITIQQSGAYRVKGMLGELQRGGIIEGSRITIRSRTDEGTWSGTVTLVDYENPSQGSEYDMYYGMSSDEMTSASKYPFYIELDSVEGLLLGQHVYLELEAEETATDYPAISSTFICYEEDGTPYVWAENRGKLEKRSVTLGEYNPMTDQQEITEGLTKEDYIAFPDSELCQEGASTTHDLAVEETEATEGEVA